MLLVKLPMPELSVVWLSLVVGYSDLELQHTPRAVTADPPVRETLPPQVSVVLVTLLAAVVVTMGRPMGVVKVIWLPYAVSTALIAYART